MQSDFSPRKTVLISQISKEGFEMTTHNSTYQLFNSFNSSSINQQRLYRMRQTRYFCCLTLYA
jgi:hypothetical protein